MRRLLVPCLVLLGILQADLMAARAASESTAQDADNWIMAHLFGVRERESAAALRARLLQFYAAADVDGGGITGSDAKLTEEIELAQRRANRISSQLARDLDGDGIVTRQEMEAVLRRQATRPLGANGAEVFPTDEQVRQILNRMVDDALKADANHDGKLTLSEMGADPGSARRSSRRQAMVPMYFDANGDAVVSLTEYETTVDRVIARIDKDGDGIISAEEAANAKSMMTGAMQASETRARQETRRQEAEIKASRCGFPTPAAGSRVVLIGAYQGDTVSNISLGGDDVEVGVAMINVEKGDEPLYIIAVSFEATIWKITGATDRIQRLVVQSANGLGGTDAPRAGVVGVQRDKITFAHGRDCMRYFTNPDGGDGIAAGGEALLLIGRKPDVIAGSYDLRALSIPSGQLMPEARFPARIATPTKGPSGPMWRESLRYYGGGVADMRADEVLSEAKAAPYVVLPQQAGLAQLIDEGALEIAESSPATIIGPDRRVVIVGAKRIAGGESKKHYNVPTELRIVKKTRFPAGLSGAHAIRFILAKGVPMPDGDPGHSRVLSADTGEELGRLP